MRSVWALILLAACGSKGSSKPDVAVKDAATAVVAAPDAAPPPAPDQPVAPGDPYTDPALAAGTLIVTTSPATQLHVVAIDVAGQVVDTLVTTDGAGVAELTGLVHDGTVAYHVLGEANGQLLETDPIVLGDLGARVEPARGGIQDVQDPVLPDQVLLSIAGTPGEVHLVELATGAEVAAIDHTAAQLGPVYRYGGLHRGAIYVARADDRVSKPLLAVPGVGQGRSIMMMETPMVQCTANLLRAVAGLHGWMRCQVWQSGGAPRNLATPLRLPAPASATKVTVRDPRLPLTVDGTQAVWNGPVWPGVVDVDLDYELAVTGGRVEVATIAPQPMARIAFAVEASKTLAVTDVTGAQYLAPDFSEGDARHGIWADYIKAGTAVRFVVTGVTTPEPCELLGEAPWTASGDPAPAPDVVGRTRDGKEVTLSSLRGKPVVVNLFASWTPPSKDEAPKLVALQRVLAPIGVELVVMASDASFDVVDPLIPPASGVTVWLDPQDGPSLYSTGKGAHAFGTTALPETYLIDADGLVRHWIVNARDWTSPDALACLQTLNTKWTGAVTDPRPRYVAPPPELAGTLDVGVDGPPGVLLLRATSDAAQAFSVIRIEHPVFPQAFTMSEPERFTKDTPLSGTVEVTARIDQDGDPDTYEPGDRSGTARVQAGDLRVHVTIDQVVR